jgi:hypothetical protein
MFTNKVALKPEDRLIVPSMVCTAEQLTHMEVESG